MFDVVIPVYKTRPEHLREAIDSVIAQSCTEWEIYISDGTPEDHEWHSRKVLADYSDKRIHIMQQEGKGISNARNQAGKAGTQRFIATLDSDDTWYELKLEYYKQLIAEKPNTKILWGRANIPIKFTSPKGNEYEYEAAGGILKNWEDTLPKHRWFRVGWNPLMTSTQVYARKVIEEVGWWDEYRTMGEDTALNVSILKLYPNDCIQVEAATGTYRVHPLQTTKGGESHGAESGILVEGRPDTFDNMVAQLREDDPSIDEDYWNALITTMNQERQAGKNERIRYSMRTGAREYV